MLIYSKKIGAKIDLLNHSTTHTHICQRQFIFDPIIALAIRFFVLYEVKRFYFTDTSHYFYFNTKNYLIIYNLVVIASLCGNPNSQNKAKG